MAIPESQLTTWSHQGSITQSSDTYNAVKKVLTANTTPYATKSFRVFLQGSYGNDTNIYAESDVDIVIVLDDCFHSDLESLTEPEKAAYKQAFVDANYRHADFKRDVVSVLKDAYGADVDVGDKAVAIAANGSRRKTDVIVAVQFRRYSVFRSASDSRYEEGICFFNSAGERIANYPKQHSANLTSGHQSASGWLKPMVRILKNLRSKLVSDGKIKSGTAPSYYLEGLLYNVPIKHFGGNYQDSLQCVLDWYASLDQAGKNNLVCANEQYYLLRDNSHTCWSPDQCDAFVRAVRTLWNNW
jgi:hypothetical protein